MNGVNPIRAPKWTGHMVDKEQTTEDAPATPPAPRRGPGHRGADMRDTVAEMAERAQLISQEAGSKVSSAMKGVSSAAAGLAGFAIESARDLVQYMVRRGQMTQEEADKLMREAEDAYSKRPKPPAPRVADVPKVAAKSAEPTAHAAHASHASHPSHAAPASKAAPAKKMSKPAAKSASKSGSKAAAKSVKAAPKKGSKPASAASRSKPKAAAKKRK